MAHQTETGGIAVASGRSRRHDGVHVSARIAAVSPSATLAVDAKAKALKAAGRASSASGPASPTSPPPSTSWRRPRPPAATRHPQVLADRRATRAAGGPGRQDPAGLGLE